LMEEDCFARGFGTSHIVMGQLPLPVLV
jgi:hypothetical protein